MSRPRTFSATSCRRAGVSLGLGLLLVLPAGTALATPEQPSPEQESSGQLDQVEYGQLSASPDTGASTALGTTAPVTPGENESDAAEESDTQSPSVAPSTPSFELVCPVHDGASVEPGEEVTIKVQINGDAAEPVTMTVDKPFAGGSVQVQGTTAVYRAPSSYTSNQDYFNLTVTDADGTRKSCNVTVIFAPTTSPTPTEITSPTQSPSPSPTRTEPTTRTPTASQTQTATQTVTAPAPTATATASTPWFPGDGGSNPGSGQGSAGQSLPQGPFDPGNVPDDGAAESDTPDAEQPTATETATVSVTSMPSDSADESSENNPDASDAEAAGQQEPARLAAPGWLLPAGLIAVVLLVAAGLLAWTSRNRGGGNHR